MVDISGIVVDGSSKGALERKDYALLDEAFRLAPGEVDWFDPMFIKAMKKVLNRQHVFTTGQRKAMKRIVAALKAAPYREFFGEDEGPNFGDGP